MTAEMKIPHYHVFMMCCELNGVALSELPVGFHFRTMRSEELELWKGLQFDADKVPLAHQDFMNKFVQETYGNDLKTFFNNTLFVCDHNDTPVATCSRWNVYGKFHAIHWLKTLQEYEGQGLGRAVLSEIMRSFRDDDYPIFVHTHPDSYRAIKLYSDFGFKLLKSERIGPLSNDLKKSLPILRKIMHQKDFEKLHIVEASPDFLNMMRMETKMQF